MQLKYAILQFNQQVFRIIVIFINFDIFHFQSSKRNFNYKKYKERVYSIRKLFKAIWNTGDFRYFMQHDI